jgi:diguanylate cyclase (GGDEF)-like protein
MKADRPDNEAVRLSALREYGILDTPPEKDYDDITYLASLITGTPIAIVSLVDEDRQWFKSTIGTTTRETSRDIAFCAHAILEPARLFIVPDASEDERFATNPLVTADPKIRFYAGAPLVTPGGEALGALCVIDRVARELTAEQERAMRALSRQVMAQLELRRVIAKLRQHAAAQRRNEEQLQSYQEQLVRANARLEVESTTDVLTGLMNRRAFDRRLEEELDRALRYGSVLSLAIMDIDKFKSYNDDLGHLAGDEMLNSLARVLMKNSRASDFVARIGGEEFAVILPSTDARSALVMAERFRRAVEAAPWEGRRMTVSIGVSTLVDPDSGSVALISAADRALYDSKRGGRNRVSHANDPLVSHEMPWASA